MNKMFNKLKETNNKLIELQKNAVHEWLLWKRIRKYEKKAA